MRRSVDYLSSLLNELRMLPNETDWVEFKVNNESPDEIGDYISALSNSAAYIGKMYAYMVWGIDDKSHEIVGTRFNPLSLKKGNEEFKSWVMRLLSPHIAFQFYELNFDEKNVVILEIQRASDRPIQFKNNEYIRIGSYKKQLKEYHEIER